MLCVQCWTPDDGQRDCPKHVDFYFKNKLEISVHLVGFIIRIYYDVRCSECQNPQHGQFIYNHREKITANITVVILNESPLALKVL